MGILTVPTCRVREGRARALPRACLVAGAQTHWHSGPTSPWIPGGGRGSTRRGSWASLGGLLALLVCVCVRFLWGQEALRKIITTLAVKNEEIQSFIYSLKQMLLNVEVRPTPPQEGGRRAGRSWAGGWKGRKKG